MPSKFDEYLNKGGFSEQEQAATKEQIVSAQEVNETQSPGDIEQESFTPHPKDAGKQDKAGQEATVEEVSQTLKDQGVEAEAPETSTKDSLANYPTKEPKAEEQGQEQTHDIDRWEDDGGR